MGLSAALVTGLAVVAPTSAGAATGPIVFDDMEHGAPLANGWFTFPGSGGGGIDPNNTDLPPADGGLFSLQTGWGGAAGFYGGFGRTNPTDLTDTDHFNFWINPDADQEYTLEINLQEDDNTDDAINPPDDDEFQFNCVVSATGPCAVAGAGWQLVSVPFTDFFDDGSFLWGGNGVLDPISESNGGNGQLINVVIAVVGNGSDVTFRTDYWTFTEGPVSHPTIVDDFEGGVEPGTPCPAAPGLPLGFCTFNGAGSTISLANPEAPPAPELPEASSPNSVLEVDVEVTSYAGFIRGFTNATKDTWIPQNWSTREGISFWMYGEGSGTEMFVDILDNRNEDSEINDGAERYTTTFVDDFSGWRELEFPFADFTRKDVIPGAPNDGLGLDEVHGYALGALDTDGARTFYFDNVAVYGIAEPPALAVNFAQTITEIEEGTTGQVTVKLNRKMGTDDPAEVSIDFATERSNAIPDRDFTETSGTLTFVNGESRELTFPLETFDNDKFTGDKQIVIRLTNPQGMERGSLFQGSVLIKDNEEFDPKLLDDFEQGAYLWSGNGDSAISTPTMESGGGATEAVMEVRTQDAGGIKVLGSTCKAGKSKQVIPVHLLSTSDFDATAVNPTTVKFGDATETHTNKDGTPKRHVEDVNGDGLDDLVFHFRASDVGDDCSADTPLTWLRSIDHDFPLADNWGGTQTLDFWFKGTDSGEPVTVTLKNNRAADPGPKGWKLAWADEFDDPAGTPPNPANWAYEIGDTTPDGKNGWGNEELQYYTNDPKNAQTDGDGNLVITLDEADGSQECYYGACEFESARLITQDKAEFAYGRIESRLKVPTGGDGLWPAFWSLGTDITHNPWPGAGEIDIMEYVSRLPNEIFGTIHGPGYSGGQSFGGIYDFGAPVMDEYHTYAVEWEPDRIRWYVDGKKYHEATPADVPGPWVYDKPFFLLLNFAIGGNFGGAVDPENTYPQEYLVDYVRVYQGPDTAERFEASFIDDTDSWKAVSIPMTDFVRSADQPAGAPNDGLGLKQIWGYGFELPNVPSGSYFVDQVRRTPFPPPTELTVTNLDDSGEGSLREALSLIAKGGTITFNSSLAGGTINLGSPLTPARDVVVDASGAPGITLDGGGADRVLVVNAGTDVTVKHLQMTNGYGFALAGGVLNNGTLELDHVTVTGNMMEADTSVIPEERFWQGGGGIYNGEGASLTLVDSTVSGNTAGWSGGGIYSFRSTTTHVLRSTISGNVSNDVGGGLRTLGTVMIDNSTVSGNESTGWHGGAFFQTDGDVTISNSTIANNIAPGWAPSAMFIGQYGGGFVPTLTLTNTIVSGNQAYACEMFASGTTGNVVSGGNNIFQDDSCNPVGTDRVGADPMLGPLADNGGPTQTHALQPESPAIDVPNAGAAPAVDQRGFARDGSPDIGAFEFGATAAP